MKKISIITVGSEIINGEILDTNSQYLCRELTNLGYNTCVIASVGDNIEDIKNELKHVVNVSDIIFICGGLGPTKDDVTKEAVAEFVEKNLVMDVDSLETIKDRFKKANRIMTDNNLKQAYKIEGSNVIDNQNGTAPGYFLRFNDTEIYILPGPPFELTQMFQNDIKHRLPESKQFVSSKVYKCLGLGESALESKIAAVLVNDDIEYGIYANREFVDIKITSRTFNRDDSLKVIEEYDLKIMQHIGEYVYSNTNNIEKTILDLLEQRSEKIAIAESCTGGMLTSRFVDVEGSSSVLLEGVVTYSNESKIKRLNVSSETLTNFGAVSEGTCKEMAEGVTKALGADIGVAITGIAGPGGGTVDKPVGLVYISVYYNGVCKIQSYNFKGTREYIRRCASNSALSLIYNAIN